MVPDYGGLEQTAGPDYAADVFDIIPRVPSPSRADVCPYLQDSDRGTDNPGMETGLFGQRSVEALPREPVVPWSFQLPERSEIQSAPASRNVVQNRFSDFLA